MVSSLKVAYYNKELNQEKRAANWPWIEKCLKDPSAFPYHLKEKGKVILEDNFDYWTNSWPTGTSTSKPVYLINIPLAYGKLITDPNFLTKLLNLFKNQAFGATPEKSENSTDRRIAIVIGVNYPRLLSKCKQQKFVEYKFAPTASKVEGVAVDIFKFFWQPEMVSTMTNKNIYSAEEAYSKLKSLKIESALQVRKFFAENLRSQIPYQQIRERIKTSKYTLAFEEFFAEHAPKSPLYFGVMDADCYGLRGRVGLFTKLDDVISSAAAIAVISCGYRIRKNEAPIIQLGVKIDMRVREAMNLVVPYSCYFPEPGSFFLVRPPGQPSILEKLSFLGVGHDAESRQLIKKGRKYKYLGKKAVFLPTGGVITETPKRMKTVNNQSIGEVTPDNIKNKKTLQALRNITQSHLFPLIWANNLYNGLQIVNSDHGKVKKWMSHVFAVYDPISRMFALAKIDGSNYSKRHFDEVMKEYKEGLSDVQEGIIEEAKNELEGLGITKKQIELIEKAAKASGKAIFEVLSEFTME